MQLNLKPEIVIRILKSIKNWHLTVNAWQDLFNQICLHMNVLNSDYQKQNQIAKNILDFFLNNRDSFLLKVKFKEQFDYYSYLIAIRHIQGKTCMQISNELNIKHWIILDFLRLRKLSRVIINQLRRNYFLATFNKDSNNIDSIAYKILIDFEKYTSSKNYKSFMINDILDIECIEID